VSFSSASPETVSTINFIYFLPSTIATDAPFYVVQKENYEASKAKENNGAEDDAVKISNPGIALGTQPRWGWGKQPTWCCRETQAETGNPTKMRVGKIANLVLPRNPGGNVDVQER
jgi:hypothetical protein